MKIKKFIGGNGLKNLIISIAVILVVLAVLAGVLNALYENARRERLAALSDSYNSISDELEFNGLTDNLKSKIDEYSKLYRDKANVIITDMDGNIVYSLNSAYIPEKGRFLTIYRQDTPYVYIIDSTDKIRYVAYLYYEYANYGSNSSVSINKRLGLQSAKYQDVAGLENRPGQGFKTDFEGENFSVFMVGSNISSKGYLLYSVSTHTPSGLVESDKSIKIYDDLLHMIGPGLFSIILLIFWLLLPIWVFADAQKRGFRAALWTILTLLANIIGLIIYLMVRPEYTKCVNCNEQLSSRFIVCPHCGARNKELCSSCKQVVEPEWVACPYCGQPKASGLPPETGLGVSG